MLDGNRWRAWVRTPRVAIVLLLVVTAVPVVQQLAVQSASRLAFTGAIVDDGTIRLDGYRGVLLQDRIVHEGHTYSDKSPGQPFLAVPLYAAARAVGAEPAKRLIVEGNLTVWWLSLWFAFLPAVAIVAAGYRAAERRFGVMPAVLGTVSLTFGWLVLPYTVQLYGHLFAAALGYASWRLLRRDTEPAAWAAGVLAGLAVVVEYQLVLLVVIIGTWLLIRRRLGSLARFVAGGIPGAIALGAYHWAIFGQPFQTTYGTKDLRTDSQTFIVGVPTPRGLAELLVGSRGVLVFTPIVVVVVAGLVTLVRRPRDAEERTDARLSVAVLVGYVLLVSGWRNAWGGEEPGPRYLISALPFLFVGAAAGWRWVIDHPRALPFARVALVWSIANMVGPLVTPHLIHLSSTLVDGWSSRIAHGDVVPTLFTMAIGDAGWILHGALVVLATWNLTVAVRAEVRTASA